mgnify:CR=1 FL=1
MADVTVRILVDGRYILYLVENDRAYWKCIDLSYGLTLGYSSERKPITTLYCNGPKTILKDGLLMIAIHCLEDKEIIKHANSMLKAKDRKIVEASTSSQFRGTNFFNLQDLTDKQLAELYAMNRKRSDRCENCQTRQHPATRKLMYLNITIFGQGMISKEWEQELKQHHASVSIGYAEFMKGTERIRD